MGKWRQRLCSPFVRVQEPINSSEKLRSISVEDISTSAGSEKPLSQAILTQTVLLLRQIKDRYELVDDYALPEIRKAGEVIVRTAVIGLNPIDWKAPDYNFGIPELPYISGREVVGTLVEGKAPNGGARLGDRVLVISTDYRDLRKSGFQQFVLGIQFNIVRLPPRISSEAAAGLGVAFVAAALSLGVCAGLDFGDVLGGPNLLGILREKGGAGLPEDVREECLEGISQSDRIRRGDWLALWGGSSTSAFIACQLARLAGVRVMSVLDLQKHGAAQTDLDTATRPDLLIDNSDTERAISVVRSAAKERLRFGIDFIGSKTASHLLSSLATNAENAAELSETSTINDKATRADSPDMKNTQSHLIGLTGLPKTGPPSGCVYHKVPIKVFHDVPEVGRSLVLWLERLLEQGLLQPPAVLSVSDGLESVNSALDKMRRGEISGGRAVVRLAAGDR